MIVIKQLLRVGSTLSFPVASQAALLRTPSYHMAFMQMFERIKTPAELSPVFKRVTKEKGHLKSKARKDFSNKLNTRVRTQKQRLKNHKGLLKRIKIVPDASSLGRSPVEQEVQVPVPRQHPLEPPQVQCQPDLQTPSSLRACFGCEPGEKADPLLQASFSKDEILICSKP